MNALAWLPLPIRIVFHSLKPKWPIWMLLLPVELFSPAKYPMAMFSEPVVLEASALSPLAVFSEPVVLE